MHVTLGQAGVGEMLGSTRRGEQFTSDTEQAHTVAGV